MSMSKTYSFIDCNLHITFDSRSPASCKLISCIVPSVYRFFVLAEKKNGKRKLTQDIPDIRTDITEQRAFPLLIRTNFSNTC